MDTGITVSVIMAAYQSEQYIEQALRSALVQEVPLEIIVVDDCSTDQTVQIIQSMQSQYPKQIVLLQNDKNIGAAESRNRAIRVAKGEYLAFLDADDIWKEGKLKAQLDAIGAHVLCCTGRELIASDGSSLSRVIGVDQEITYDMLLHTNQISCSSALVRTEAVRAFYMEHGELHEDYILWLRILKRFGNARGINEPYLLSRMSEGGKSRNKLKSAGMQWGVYRVMGIGPIRAIGYFISYAFHGFGKYYLNGNKHE